MMNVKRGRKQKKQIFRYCSCIGCNELLEVTLGYGECLKCGYDNTEMLLGRYRAAFKRSTETYKTTMDKKMRRGSMRARRSDQGRRFRDAQLSADRASQLSKEESEYIAWEAGFRGRVMFEKHPWLLWFIILVICPLGFAFAYYLIRFTINVAINN
jgi:hypothetical protein